MTIGEDQRTHLSLSSYIVSCYFVTPLLAILHRIIKVSSFSNYSEINSFEHFPQFS